jgi:hypothetical protein
VRGALISDHPYPRPALRQVTGWLVALGLIGDAFAVIGLLIPLLPLMAIIMAVLDAPLLLLTVLHPHITVYENGLWLKPLLWHGSWLPWEALSRMEDHTLIQRGQQTRRQTPREGRLIVVDRGLPRLYEIVGIMAGLGRVRAFGIASPAHQDYPALFNAIQRHKPRS